MLNAILAAAGLFLVSISGVTVAAGDGGATTPIGTKTTAATFPRLMGMNIGAKNYQSAAYQAAMARLDVVILGFYRGWQNGYAASSTQAMRKAVQAIKAINPR